jgi:hypothetical protein
MITPTVGRIVWVHRVHGSEDIKQPEAGIILYVHSDRLINVEGWSASGHPFALLNLHLVQDDERKPEGNFACWMPYQKGQAAKSEQLANQLATQEALNAQEVAPA